MINIRDDILINGVSIRTIGLIPSMPPVPPMAKRRYVQWENGSDTIGCYPDDYYDPISYPITARIIGNPRSFDNSAIYAFLHDARTLKISRLPGFYFKIAQVDGISPKAAVRGNEITYSIGFKLQPWKYHDNNDEIPLPQGGIIVNPGTRYSKPVVRLLKSGADQATVTTNGQQLKIFGAVSGALTIDSERMIVYKTHNGVNTAITQYTDGPLPMLAPGNNQITVSSNISSVGIVGNWRNY